MTDELEKRVRQVEDKLTDHLATCVGRHEMVEDALERIETTVRDSAVSLKELHRDTSKQVSRNREAIEKASIDSARQSGIWTAVYVLVGLLAAGLVQIVVGWLGK